MAKRGRPVKLTPEVQEKLLTAIRAGNYYESACAYAGISYVTFRNWMLRGEKAKKGKFFDFFKAVKRAEAEAEARVVALWQKQIPENWQAARDFLERRYPERWGRKDRIEHSGELKVSQTHEIVERIVATHPELLDEIYGDGDDGGEVQ